MKEPNTTDQLDILLHIERLTEELNKRMSTHSKVALKRYPLTFGIIALFGVIAVSEGAKGLLEQVFFLQHQPLYLFLVGIAILLILGSVYKRLSK